jgi:iron complex outermembrane receptor protein
MRKTIAKLSATLVALFCFFSVTFAQNRTITGTVTDQNGAAVSGATVTVRGTNTATQTDASGSFSISAGNNAVLDITSVGYGAAQVSVGTGSTVTATLTTQTSNLNEVVVVGYGTSRRRDVTGAVTKVTAAEFNTGVISNPLQQVQGKVAGLVIVQPGSDPNSNVTVRLRGSTSLEGQPPLLVIDGVAIDDFNRGINSVAPNDIESYDILRDASSAAIYGSRGANGVIIITTKKGRAGRTLIDYSTYGAVDQISNKLELLSADEWRKAVGTSPLDRGANSNWQELITRRAITHSHTLGISGGAGGFSYRASLNLLDNQGIVITTGKRLLSGRFTATQKALNDKLNFQFGLNATETKRDQLSDQGDARTGAPSNVFNLAFNYLPVWPVFNDDGSYFQQIDFDLENPVAFLKNASNKRRENFYQGHARIDYDILKGWRVGTFGAISRAVDVSDFFNYGIPGATPDAPPQRINSAFKNVGNKQVNNFDLHTSYRKTFSRHTIDLTGVYEYNKFINDGFGVSAQNFIVPELESNNIGATNDRAGRGIGSGKSENILISYLARMVYNFDDRYIFQLNYRRDGSSKFGTNNQWGNFPSASLAWRVNNEGFLKSINWINELKFRISYGLTGNQENIGNYQTQQLFGSSGTYLDFSGGVGSALPLQSYQITQLPNPDLKWEVRKSFNVGVDFSLFNNRLNGTLDVFNDETEDLLFQYDLPTPPFLYNTVIANAADATNKGIELTLGGTIYSNKNFRWEARGNIASLRNRVTNLSGQFQGADLSITARNYGFVQGRGLSNFPLTRLVPGQPAGVFWLPESAGLDTAGKQLYNQYDDKGQLTGTALTFEDEDRRYIDPTPKFTWGLTNNFSYSNFDLSIFFRGVQGQKIFANTLLNLETVTRLPGNNVTPKALTNGFTEQPQPTNYWLRDASYARLENLTLGYNFRQGFSPRIESLRLFAAANNLLVITDYEGIDPEIKVEGSNRYIDRNLYPKTRSFSVGLNVTFK